MIGAAAAAAAAGWCHCSYRLLHCRLPFMGTVYATYVAGRQRAYAQVCVHACIAVCILT